jgi:hypothetical protein
MKQSHPDRDHFGPIDGPRDVAANLFQARSASAPAEDRPPLEVRVEHHCIRIRGLPDLSVLAPLRRSRFVLAGDGGRIEAVGRSYVRSAADALKDLGDECNVLHPLADRALFAPESGGSLGRTAVGIDPPDPRLLRIAKEEVVAPAGLAAPTLRLLAAGGYRYRVVADVRYGFWEPDRAALGGLGALDEAVLALFRDHDRGLIRFDRRGVDPARLVAQLAAAYPTLRFLAVAYRRADIRAVGERLSGLRVDVDWAWGPSGPMPRNRRVVVAPFYACTDQSRQVVIVLDPLAALGRDQLDWIRCARPLRLFGLLDGGRRPSPRDGDDLVALFGPAAASVPAHGRVERPVLVAWKTVLGGKALGGQLAGVELLRRGLWTDRFYHRVVGRLARELAASEPGWIGEILPGVSGRHMRGPRPAVAVLVGTVEQALALGEELRDWTIVVGPGVASRGLPAAQRDRLRADRPVQDDCPPRVITTPGGLATGAVGEPDVLVRADGGVGLPTGFADTLTSRYDEVVEAGGGGVAWPARPLVLVDFVDKRHAVLRKRSAARQRAYSERGWGPGSLGDSFERHLAGFLAGRPGA